MTTHTSDEPLAHSVVEAPAWTRVRVAHPVHDLARSVAFYRDLLRLPVHGGFADHDGYDGVFLTLPGGGELELTAGSATVSGGTEDLLVLYVADLAAVGAIANRLTAGGAPTVESPNPYWNRYGRTFVDPDGYRVVVATPSPTTGADRPDIAWFEEPRETLRHLFELAEDSASELDSYLDLGRVLVARRAGRAVGHVQLVPTDTARVIELKNMAVLPEQQGTGIGRALVDTALQRCRVEGWTRMVVATATADIGNLRFYQRIGFRFVRVERDAFTPATGYPDPIAIDGIPLRDRVWLDQPM